MTSENVLSFSLVAGEDDASLNWPIFWDGEFVFKIHSESTLPNTVATMVLCCGKALSSGKDLRKPEESEVIEIGAVQL